MSLDKEENIHHITFSAFQDDLCLNRLHLDLGNVD